MAYRLALIIAPQGSGKTRRLRQWAAWRSSSGQSAPCWASLTEQDNNLAHFLPHLASALIGLDAQLDRKLRGMPHFAETRVDKDSKAPLPLSQELGSISAAEGFLIDLINALSEVPVEFALILDEFHQIGAPEVHQAMDFLLEYLPPQMHLYLAARGEPPLRLAHLRARRQMIQIEVAEMFDIEPAGL